MPYKASFISEYSEVGGYPLANKLEALDSYKVIIDSLDFRIVEI